MIKKISSHFICRFLISLHLVLLLSLSTEAQATELQAPQINQGFSEQKELSTSEAYDDQFFPLDSFLSLQLYKNRTSSVNNFYKNSLYKELHILEDKSGSVKVTDLPLLKNQFSQNNTKIDFRGSSVYWIQLDMIGQSAADQDYLFHFSSNGLNQSWDHIETWLILENGDTLFQKTGHSIANQSKPIPSELNLLEYSIGQGEKASLYIRLEGISKELRHQAQHISIDLIHRDMYPGAFEGYPFKGHFPGSSEHIFRGNPITNHEFFIEPDGEVPIEMIHKDWANLPKTDLFNTLHKPNKTYWLKANIHGSPYLTGKQIFHIAPNMGDDRYTFDYVDTYITKGDGQFSHQRTGDHVPQSERPYSHWANLIEVDIQETDTLEVYMRLQGADARFLMTNILLFHIDKDSLFPSQVNLGLEHGVFYGILAIQVLFFIILFFIERDRIHLFFSLMFFSVLLGELASTESYMYGFVVFSSFRDYSIPIYYLAMFLGSVGILKFTEHYFNYDRDHIYSKWFIPGLLIVSAIVNIGASQQVEIVYDDYSSWEKLDLVSQYLILASLAFSFFIAYMAPIQKSILKKLYFIAFSPTLITCFALFLEQVIFIQPENYDFLIYFRIAIILTATLLALTIGFRTNKLKEEKTTAEKLVELEEKERLRLQELDDIKTRIYTNITHEFRTPLTVIMGINDALTNTTKDLKLPVDTKEKFNQSQQLIQRNSKNLLTLVNQLLDLSKSDSNQLSLQLIQGDIISYLNYLTESFFSQAKEKDIRLVFYSELSSLLMDYDEQKMQHIAYNLLSNAIKFGEPNGKIVVHATKTTSADQPMLQLILKDTGIGIPEDQLPYIFDRFYQVDDSHTRQVGGSGIGLSLTKDMIELMGGDISVESQLDEGTTFTVRIPITNRAEGKQPEAYANSSYTAPSKQSAPLSEAQLETQLETSVDSQYHVNPADDKPILLIVEDNEDVFSYLKLVLGQTYQIIKAINGSQGVDKAIENIPDLIISDVMMPIKDGYKLTSELKEDTRTSHIPIILLTAKATNNDKLTGLKIGADAYLGKPFDKEELLIRIDQLLANRNKLKKHYASVYNMPIIGTVEDKSQAVSTPIGQDKEEQFLKDIRQFIIDNIKNEDINGANLAQVKGISQSQLYRKIKALTGDTPNSLIRDIRLQESIIFLSNPDYNISDIAYAVGFSNPSYFSRAFHKKYGQSPVTYRKAL